MPIHFAHTTFRPLLLALTAALAACAPTATPSPSTSGHTFVLVHGAWMGAYPWTTVKQGLEQAGDHVITLDLPGHGDDTAPLDRLSLADDKNAVLRAIGDRTNVVLVGHSFGGLVISAVAEDAPNKVSKLVYVAALLPQNGDSLLSLSSQDEGSRVLASIEQQSPQAGTPVTIKASAIPGVFAADASPEVQTLLVRRHRAEAFPPLATPVTLSAGRYGAVPKYYVETLRDSAVSHNLQLQMLGRVPVVQRFALDTSHVPFFTRSAELAAILHGLK